VTGLMTARGELGPRALWQWAEFDAGLYIGGVAGGGETSPT
jgi:hypothetical protein